MEILLDNKQGTVWDVSEIVSSPTWKTSRNGKPGRFDFSLIKNSLWQERSFSYNNGDIVRFRYKGQDVFYGYIFSVDGGKNESVKIKCYDQIRYLTNKDTYVFSNATVTEIVRQIANDFNLRTGILQDSLYRIPAMVEDGQSLIDIIDKALALTLINADLNYVLYDDFGSLTLRNIEDMLVDFYIGDDSLLHNYSYRRSIDSDTYNKIKVYQDNEETGRREIYVAQDSGSIARWGTLQLYQQADENMNAAQIEQMVDTLIQLKNRETKTLKLDCIGDIRVRAGCYVPVVIDEYNINQPFVVDEVSHRWNGSDHQMQVTLKVV